MRSAVASKDFQFQNDTLPKNPKEEPLPPSPPEEGPQKKESNDKKSG
jgi:hypothetical protein